MGIQTTYRSSHAVHNRRIQQSAQIHHPSNVVAFPAGGVAQISRTRIYTQHILPMAVTEHFATFKFGANTGGIMDAVADISPPLDNVVAVQFIGYKLRANVAPQEIKIVLNGLAGWTPEGYYAAAGNLSDPALTQVPQGPNNNGILLTPLALAGGLTDQDDSGVFANNPQTVMTNCKGAITRLQFAITDFSGQGTLSVWSGHLYLRFKFLRLAKPDMYSPAKQTTWQKRLRDGYVERGDGF